MPNNIGRWSSMLKMYISGYKFDERHVRQLRIIVKET